MQTALIIYLQDKSPDAVGNKLVKVNQQHPVKGTWVKSPPAINPPTFFKWNKDGVKLFVA